MQAISLASNSVYPQSPFISFDRANTDLKIYETFAKSPILTKFGVLLAAGSALSIVYAPVSIACAGFCLGVTLIALDKFFFRAVPLHTHPAPFVKGQPIGINNASANCWANAALQLILASPGLCEHLRQNRSPVFGNAIKNYQKAQSNREHIASNIDSQKIREWLAEKIQFSHSAEDQEDAHEALSYIMRTYQGTKIEVRRTRGSRSNETWPILTLHLAHHQQRKSFEELVERNFLSFQDPRGGGTRRLKTCPSELFFHLSRFDRHGNKIADRIKLTPSFKLSSRWTTNGTSANYSCQAFIQHEGSSADSGHYVCYVKRQGLWWRCDDDAITQVSEGEAAQQLKRCYLCYFSRN